MAKKAAQPKKEKAVKEKKSSGKKADVSVIFNARVTEKTANASAMSVYVFDVAPSATKSEVAKAFEAIYKHVPLKVHTLIKKPKAYFRRNTKGGTLGFSKKIKKAYVYLPKGTNIEVM